MVKSPDESFLSWQIQPMRASYHVKITSWEFPIIAKSPHESFVSWQNHLTRVSYHGKFAPWEFPIITKSPHESFFSRPWFLASTPQVLFLNDWLGRVYRPLSMISAGYLRYPCYGHGRGCVWLLLLMPKTGGDMWYDTLGAISKGESCPLYTRHNILW